MTAFILSIGLVLLVGVIISEYVELCNRLYELNRRYKR